MRITVKTLVVVSLFVATCVAQSGTAATGSNTQAINAQNQNNVCRIFFQDPKPGMDAQFVAARKKHNAFHAAQKDTWTWSTFAVLTGDFTGRYVTTTCGHAWKDFDEWEARMGKADAADAGASLGPTVQGGRNGFYTYRADMSLAPTMGNPPSPLTSVTVYSLHPGAAPDFIAAVKKINDALSKQTDWPKTSGWLQLANGGGVPTFVLLNQRKNWADFEPLPKTVQDVLTETYGKDAADQLLKTIRDSTEHLYTEIGQYRADLSYIPAK
jgi:hypothetical protein